MSPEMGAANAGAQGARRLHSVVGALLSRGTLSRTELAAITGYSQSSMTESIRELLRLGFVVEIGQGKSTGGRRRTLLRFERRGVRLTLLSLEAGNLVARQVDLAGTVHVQVGRRLDPNDPLSTLVSAVDTLRQVAEEDSIGAVISMPGVVSAEGDVTLAPAFGLTPSRRVQDVVAEASGLHTIAENDVNLMALGEWMDGAGRDGGDFALIYVGDGIGSAMMLDGRVHRGVTGSAGEIGFLPWNGHLPTSGGTIGPLEGEWSIPALTAKAEAAGIELGGQHVIDVLEDSGALEAQRLLDDALNAWAYPAIVTACVINPGRIVFAGETTRLSDAGRERLAARVHASSTSPVQVRFAELGEAAIVRGAIAHLQKAPWIFLPGAEDRPSPPPERLVTESLTTELLDTDDQT